MQPAFFFNEVCSVPVASAEPQGRGKSLSGSRSGKVPPQEWILVLSALDF
jgi:hypothetical protein